MNEKYRKIGLSFAIVIGALILYYIVTTITGKLFDYSKMTYFVDLIDYSIMAIFLVAVLYTLKKIKVLSFEGKSFIKGLKVSSFLLMIILLFFIIHYSSSIKNGDSLLPLSKILAFTIATVFGVGFFEEVLCRGIVQNLMYDVFRKKTYSGLVKSVFAAAIIFGLAHYLNLITTDMTFFDVTNQVITATGGGLIFGAIYARCNNIWVPIFVHGLFDFNQLINNGFFGGKIKALESTNQFDFSSIIIAIIEIVFALFLLRKKKLQKERIIEEQLEK